MMRALCILWVAFISLLPLNADTSLKTQPEGKAFIIPIQGNISQPQLYILRRALKQAIAEGIDTVLLDIDTPGGRADTTLEMMEALDNFTGTTIAFINEEAISAGSLIAIVTDDIYFHPDGIMGAAAAVLATGQDLGETLDLKINSYMAAKVRTYTDEHPYKADVQKAMMNKDFILKVGDKVIKDAGELLTLTANEAYQMYGQPPKPLLATGIAETTEEILNKHYKDRPYKTEAFTITWSEELAKWLNLISPGLMGIGMLLLITEINSPGFGLPGILGVACLLIVFSASHIAGLAGYEAMLIAGAGLLLIAVEIFIAPGTFIGIFGVLLFFAGIFWSMLDIWDIPDFTWDFEMLEKPLIDFGIAILIAGVGSLILIRFTPRSWIWNKLILSSSVAAREAAIPSNQDKVHLADNIGKTGTVITDLTPSGAIEINGVRYEAKTSFGLIQAGETVTVTGISDFGLIVKKTSK